MQRFVHLETSTPVFNMLYRYGQITMGPHGAYGPNITAPQSSWFLEYQRAGNIDVIGGVLRHDAHMVAAGLQMFHFGLAREAANGSFPGSAWPFHGTAMFLAEAGPALIVLKYSSMNSQFRTEIAWQIRRMRKAARHLVKVVGGAGNIDDATKNHRYFEAAMALGSVGVLAGDAALVRWSRVYAWKGIRMVQASGVMPENGGHDSGYQALGMVHATRYLELLARGQLATQFYQVLQRGESWERSRILPDGNVNQQGDTRTVQCRERDPVGRCKTTFYATIFNALARWSVISGDLRYERTAYQVWVQNWRLIPGDVLPRPGLWARPGTLSRGSWLTVWGAGFQPLEPVQVFFGDQRERNFVCDQIGTFGAHSPVGNAYFPVPDVAPGTYVVIARGSFGTIRHTRVVVTS